MKAMIVACNSDGQEFYREYATEAYDVADKIACLIEPEDPAESGEVLVKPFAIVIKLQWEF